MRSVIRFGVLALSTMTASATATAQQPTGTGDAPAIVVTGNRDVETQVRQFVTAMTPAPQRGNIPLLESDVCPMAIGFVPRQKAAIERRLRAVALAAGWRVLGEGCVPNVVFIATENKERFISSLWRNHPSYFGPLMSASEISRLIRAPGPTAAWRAEQFLTAGGTAYVTPDSEDPSFSFNQMNARASRITTGTRRAVGAAILVAEQGALAGLTTTQLADYAAMRLFARTDPASVPPGVSTILAVVDAPPESEIPVTLTQWDLSFLRALKAAPTSLFSAAQRGEIARRMARDLTSTPTARE